MISAYVGVGSVGNGWPSFDVGFSAVGLRSWARVTFCSAGLREANDASFSVVCDLVEHSPLSIVVGRSMYGSEDRVYSVLPVLPERWRFLVALLAFSGFFLGQCLT